MSDIDSNSRSAQDATSQQDAPTHQNFHWIEGPAKGSPLGNYIEATLDLANDIEACLQVAYASNLARAANDDADPGQTARPAVGIVTADRLARMAIVTAALLGEEARRQVESMTETGAG